MSDVEWMELFSEGLNDILKEKNMTQQELAEECNLAKSTISQYIHGTRFPTYKAILNMSYALDMNIHEFADFGEAIE